MDIQHNVLQTPDALILVSTTAIFFLSYKESVNVDIV